MLLTSFSTRVSWIRLGGSGLASNQLLLPWRAIRDRRYFSLVLASSRNRDWHWSVFKVAMPSSGIFLLLNFGNWTRLAGSFVSELTEAKYVSMFWTMGGSRLGRLKKKEEEEDKSGRPRWHLPSYYYPKIYYEKQPSDEKS